MPTAKKAGPRGSAAKPKTSPGGVAGFDFSELQHYVDHLEINRESPEARERNLYAIRCLVAALPNSAGAGMLLLHASRFAAWGGSFEAVREAFLALVVSSSGYVVAQAVREDDRRLASRNGAKGGGRPKSPHHKKWLMLFEEKRSKRSDLSASDIFKIIANNWVDEWGVGRDWKTIRDGIASAKKKANGKTPIPR